MDIKRELQEAEANLLALEQQRAAIERQMHAWVKVIEGLRVLDERGSFDDVPTREDIAMERDTPSLPSKIIAVLSQMPYPISTTQIRDWLIMNRAVESGANNLMINVHTALRRLIKAGHVEELRMEDESKLYRYIGPMERALKAPYGARTSLANTLMHNFGPTPVLDTRKKR